MRSPVNSSQRQDSILRQFTAVERGHSGWPIAREETSSTGSSRQQMGTAARHRNALIPHKSWQIEVFFVTNCKQVSSKSLSMWCDSNLIKPFVVYSYCEDDRYQKQDRDCWTGDHLGDYTHKVMDMHSQKYNPEVPTLQANNNDRLHQLNDQLITLKNMVNKQVRIDYFSVDFYAHLSSARFSLRWQSRFISWLGKWGQLILILHNRKRTKTNEIFPFSIVHI